MTDSSLLPPLPIDAATKDGKGKTWAGILAAICASYMMNWLSLHGVNFEVWKIPSELVKATIIGHLVGFFVWVTPKNFVGAIGDGLRFVHDAATQWWNALRYGKE